MLRAQPEFTPFIAVNNFFLLTSISAIGAQSTISAIELTNTQVPNVGTNAVVGPSYLVGYVDADVAEPYSIFDKRQKGLIVFIAATAATFSGFASNIYFPALATVASDLGVTIELINLTITSYLILQGLAPSIWGPLSDAKGRRVAYCCTFLVFLGACIGLAETRNYATLVVLRSLQSSGSASTIAVGSAVIGDLTTCEERAGD